jgi:hypothetical protein
MMPMSSRRSASCGCQKSEADAEQQRQQQRDPRRDRGRQQAGGDEQHGEQLDRRVEHAVAQDVGLQGVLHELGERSFEHHQKGDAEQRQGHRSRRSGNGRR